MKRRTRRKRAVKLESREARKSVERTS